MPYLSESEYIKDAVKALSKDQEIEKSFAADMSALETRLSLYESNRYRLAVMGVTSSGKSTLLNALLGKKLLPAVAVPSSSQLVSCIKGDKLEATVFFEDGKKKTFTGRHLTSDVISQYGDEKYNPKNKKGVKQIEIVSPDLLTPKDLVLEDSPGLDAYGLEGHEHITMHTLLPSTDFCMFVTTCKTNSDQKTLEVLNEIARYDKHVIIIQNMIDSLKASPDGRQSVQDVANDHLRRIQRIVDKSDIKDKSRIHIVQVSAKYALEVRTYKIKNQKDKDNAIKVWKASNFDEFQTVIGDVFNAVKPKIEQSRLIFLRKELEDISGNICPKLTGNAPTRQVNYEQIKSDLQSSFSRTKEAIEHTIGSMKLLRAGYALKNICGEYEINDVKARDNEIAKRIAQSLGEFNDTINNISSKINVSSRDYAIRIASKKSKSLSASFRYTTGRGEKKKGFLNSLKRFFGSDSGYEKKTIKSDNHSENKKNILEYIDFSCNDLIERTQAWERAASSVVDRIDGLIDEKQAQFKAALEAFNNEKLSQEKLLEVKKELQLIINRLPTKDYQMRTEKRTHHAINHQTSKVEVTRETFSMIGLAKEIIRKVNQYLWAAVLEGCGSDVVSWDIDSARRFMHTSLGIDFSQSSNTKLFKSISCGYVKLVDMNNEKYQYSDRKVLVMLNATQSGAAKKQVKPLIDQLAKKSISSNKVVFIIQDLEEVVEGGDLRGSMQDIRGFLNKNGFGDSLVLPNHRNPIYALALYERYQRHKLHAEEMNILSTLRSKFSYFFEGKTEEIIADLLREN